MAMMLAIILLLISFSSLLNKVACLSPLVRGFVSFNGGAAAMSALRMTVANSWMGCFSSFSDNGWKMVEHWGVELVLCFRNKGTILKCQEVISILGYQIGGKWQWVCCLQLFASMIQFQTLGCAVWFENFPPLLLHCSNGHFSAMSAQVLATSL